MRIIFSPKLGTRFTGCDSVAHMKFKRIAVYCGSSNHVDEIFVEQARLLGRVLAARTIELVYGGGHVGLMGHLADATLAAGGRKI